MKPLPRADWQALIPHAGAMCLLDEVLEWDAEHLLGRSYTHAQSSNPLRTDAGLRAVHLCEYGAQAAAVHGALQARSCGVRQQPGLLVALREVRLACRWVSDSAVLDIQVRRVHSDAAAALYTFRVAQHGQRLAEGRALIALAI